MFWDKVHAYAWQAGMAYTVPVTLIVAILLLRRARSERSKILAVTGLFVLCSLGLLISSLMEARGQDSLAGYFRWLSIFGQGMCIISLLGVAVFRVLLPSCRLPAPQLLHDVLVGLFCLIWALIWLAANQVNVASLIATSTVLTAIIGLSFQDTLGNILGGMAIELEGSVKVGDWLRVDDLVGQVSEIRWRHTSLETNNWETVIIPNGILAKNKFLVLGRRQGEPVQWRRLVWFNVDYRYSPMTVIQTVERAIRSAEIPNVARQPRPDCILGDYTDSYGHFAARYYLTSLGADGPTDSHVRAHIYAALKRAGIPLSIPAQALFVTEETPERKAGKGKLEAAHHVDALSHVEIFHSLQPNELERLAERLIPAPFVAGDVITRQGDEAHWLYIISAGEADVVVQNQDGLSTGVAKLKAGDFFGEMGLVTGGPREATVVARTEVDCFRLDKASFQEVVRSRPSIAEEIAALIAKRRTELQAVMEHLDAESQASRIRTEQKDILSRIRAFLGLED